jgi:hypothetical protein
MAGGVYGRGVIGGYNGCGAITRSMLITM